MEERQYLTYLLFTWVAIIVLVTRSQWNKRLPSVGLPLIYLIQVTMMHGFGAMIYALPWYLPKLVSFKSAHASLAYTIAGFTQTVYGGIAFAFGSIIIAPLAWKMFKPTKGWNVPSQPNLKLPKTCILIGFLFSFLIGPILNKLPSIGVVSLAGNALIPMGLCLACWKAWCMQNKLVLIGLLMLNILIPLNTVLTSGFLGMGIVVVMPVLVFVFNFYRPRWQVIILGILTMAFALTVFVNYARERNEIRAKVWGGQGIEARIEQLQKTVSNFEFFNISKQEHLELIDMRLNLNVQVGQGVSYLSSGNVDFAGTKTLEGAVIAAVPRILWPDKPANGGSGDLVTRYTGVKYAEGTSVGVGNVLEFYISFGTWGVVLGFLFLGTLLRYIDIVAGKKLISGNWEGFISWFLPGLNLINPGGSIAEIVGAVLGSIIMLYLLDKFYLQKASRLRPLRTDSYHYNS
ncbi:hypothetical protein JYQ62_26010 [Nostoc sp. UHCC 0702]|nr:hypothetical protein JYQ62_26010 [Nostoc sp. UHCC 0702]